MFTLVCYPVRSVFQPSWTIQLLDQEHTFALMDAQLGSSKGNRMMRRLQNRSRSMQYRKLKQETL